LRFSHTYFDGAFRIFKAPFFWDIRSFIFYGIYNILNLLSERRAEDKKPEIRGQKSEIGDRNTEVLQLPFDG